MKRTESNDPHTHFEHDHGHDRGREPVAYWRRAHRDWKVWIAVLLMLVAMAVYLRSNDLSHVPRQPIQHPVP